jgi:hypothetical protein
MLSHVRPSLAQCSDRKSFPRTTTDAACAGSCPRTTASVVPHSCATGARLPLPPGGNTTQPIERSWNSALPGWTGVGIRELRRETTGARFPRKVLDLCSSVGTFALTEKSRGAQECVLGSIAELPRVVHVLREADTQRKYGSVGRARQAPVTHHRHTKPRSCRLYPRSALRSGSTLACRCHLKSLGEAARRLIIIQERVSDSCQMYLSIVCYLSLFQSFAVVSLFESH